MKKVKALLRTFICFIFVGISSCILNIPNITDSLDNNLENKINKNELYKKVIEAVKNKKKYTGPIDIKINSGLSTYENSNYGDVFSVQSYNIKSPPLGAIIFKETFVLDQNDIEIERDFKVSELSKKYTLYVKREHEQSENNAITGTIRINSFDLVSPVDFKSKINSEIIKDSIFLNSKNSMFLRLWGQKGATLTVSIIESGESGSIRKLKKTLIEHDTNEKHIKSNDINIFDPFDSSSLKQFQLYNNDIVHGNVVKISSALVNGTDKVQFEAGTIIAQFKDEVGLSIFKARYNATVEGTLDNYYKLKIDLSKSPILDTEGIIREYNKNIPVNISDVEFSSLASLQTFIVMLDFLTHFPNLLKNINLNIYQDLPSVNPVQPNDWTVNKDYILASWHLKNTNTLEAWNYSIGTGVTVAWIDNFGYKPNHPEISRRLIYSYQNKDQLDGDKACVFNCSNEVQKYHANYALMTGFAEKGNKIPTIGVAPNANVIPYGAYTSWDFTVAVANARSKKVDVIGINQNWQISYSWGIVAVYDILDVGAIPYLSEQIIGALNDKIPVVVSAHNYAKNINGKSFLGIQTEQWFPSILDGVIVVGSVTPNETSGTITYNANFTIHNPPDPVYGRISGSNYGRSDMIWAPGAIIDVSPRDYPSSDKSKNLTGTSFSNPFVTGIVALMKSRNKQLLPSEIKNILNSTSKLSGHVVHPHDNMRADNFTQDVHLINVEEAVKSAIEFNGNGYAKNFEAKDLAVGIFDGDNKDANGSRVFNLNDGTSTKLISSFSDQEISGVNRKDAVVRIMGWRPPITNPGEIEGLEISAITDKPEITGTLFTDSSGTKTSEIRNKGYIAIFGKNLFAPNIPKPKVIFTSTSNNKEYIFEIDRKSLPNYLFNEGDLVKFIFDATSTVEPSTNTPIPLGTDTFKIKFEGTLGNSNDFTLPGGLGFSVSKNNLPENFPVNGQNLPVIDDFSKTKAVASQTIAAQIPTSLGIPLLENTTVKIDGKYATLKSIVDQYVLFNVPPNIPTGLQNVFIQLAGGTVGGYVTYKDALEIIAITVGLKPAQSVTFPNGETVSPDKFIDNDPNTPPVQVYPGDTVGVSFNTNINLNDVSLIANGQRCTLQSVVDNYVAFKIPPTIDPGVINLIIEYAGGGSITLEQALEILSVNGIVNETKTLSTSQTNPIITGWTKQFTGFVTVKVNDALIDPQKYIWDRSSGSIKILGTFNAGDRVTIAGKVAVDGLNTGFPNIINGQTIPYALYYDFSEGTGNTVYDKSGNNNNGNFGGFSNTLPERFTLENGTNGVKFFNNSYLRVPDNQSYELPDSFTFLAKINIRERNKYQTILRKSSAVNGTLDSFNWWIDENNRVNIALYAANQPGKCTYYSFTEPLSTPTGNTVGLAVGFDNVNNTIKIYENQKSLSYTVVTGGTLCTNITYYDKLHDSPLDLFIGLEVADNGVKFYTGSNLQELYNIAIVKGIAFSDSQISKLFLDMGLKN